MTPLERRRTIVRMLRQSGAVNVRQLAEELNVTRVTIRADLDFLERRGLVVKSHGGAVLPETDHHFRFISNTIHENYEKKESIARAALSLIQPGSTVILDAGSTNAILARHLHGQDITVVTNSVPVIAELVTDDHVDLIAVGGAIRKQVHAMVGELARRAFASMHADVLFLGASGFTLERGVTTVNLLEAEAKQAMIHSARYVCLLVDSTKFTQIKFAKVCDWDSVDELITDQVDPRFADALRTDGVKVTVADAAHSEAWPAES